MFKLASNSTFIVLKWNGLNADCICILESGEIPLLNISTKFEILSCHLKIIIDLKLGLPSNVHIYIYIDR